MLGWMLDEKEEKAEPALVGGRRHLIRASSD